MPFTTSPPELIVKSRTRKPAAVFQRSPAPVFCDSVWACILNDYLDDYSDGSSLVSTICSESRSRVARNNKRVMQKKKDRQREIEQGVSREYYDQVGGEIAEVPSEDSNDLEDREANAPDPPVPKVISNFSEDLLPTKSKSLRSHSKGDVREEVTDKQMGAAKGRADIADHRQCVPLLADVSPGNDLPHSHSDSRTKRVAVDPEECDGVEYRHPSNPMTLKSGNDTISKAKQKRPARSTVKNIPSETPPIPTISGVKEEIEWATAPSWHHLTRRAVDNRLPGLPVGQVRIPREGTISHITRSSRDPARIDELAPIRVGSNIKDDNTNASRLGTKTTKEFGTPSRPRHVSSFNDDPGTGALFQPTRSLNEVLERSYSRSPWGAKEVSPFLSDPERGYETPKTTHAKYDRAFLLQLSSVARNPKEADDSLRRMMSERSGATESGHGNSRRKLDRKEALLRIREIKARLQTADFGKQ